MSEVPVWDLDLSRRRNYVHAAYVNAALQVKEFLGADRAAKMLAREGVSKAVIVRMLCGSCRIR
jgi:hypothetical protein